MVSGSGFVCSQTMFSQFICNTKSQLRNAQPWSVWGWKWATGFVLTYEKILPCAFPIDPGVELHTMKLWAGKTPIVNSTIAEWNRAIPRTSCFRVTDAVHPSLCSSPPLVKAAVLGLLSCPLGLPLAWPPSAMSSLTVSHHCLPSVSLPPLWPPFPSPSPVPWSLTPAQWMSLKWQYTHYYCCTLKLIVTLVVGNMK